MHSKDIILRIIQSRHNLPRTNVAKLAYLFDLACIQILGKPKTDFPYQWYYYGPYCKEIDRVLWDLTNEKKIKIEYYRTAKNRDCFLHSPMQSTPPRLSETEDKILKYIIKKFGSYTTENLQEFIYSTPPMVEAKKKNRRFKRLNLKSSEGVPAAFYDHEAMMMLINSELSSKKKYIPAEDVWRKLNERKKQFA